MSGEMYWLALSVLLCLVIWIPYTSLYGGIASVREGTANIPQTQKLPDWAQRNHRAFGFDYTLFPSLVALAWFLVALATGTEPPTLET